MAASSPRPCSFCIASLIGTDAAGSIRECADSGDREFMHKTWLGGRSARICDSVARWLHLKNSVVSPCTAGGSSTKLHRYKEVPARPVHGTRIGVPGAVPRGDRRPGSKGVRDQPDLVRNRTGSRSSKEVASGAIRRFRVRGPSRPRPSVSGEDMKRIMQFVRRMREERGITGLETAIVLIAFVVVAAVFAFVVSSTGLFSSERGKETVYAGLAKTRGSMELTGGVIATSNNTTTHGADVRRYAGRRRRCRQPEPTRHDQPHGHQLHRRQRQQQRLTYTVTRGHRQHRQPARTRRALRGRPSTLTALTGVTIAANQPVHARNQAAVRLVHGHPADHAGVDHQSDHQPELTNAEKIRCGAAVRRRGRLEPRKAGAPWKRNSSARRSHNSNRGSRRSKMKARSSRAR